MPPGDDIAQQFTVVAVAGEHVGDVHARLDASQAQQLGRVIEGVTLEIRRRTSGMSNRRIISIRRSRLTGAAQQNKSEETAELNAESPQTVRHGVPWVCSLPMIVYQGRNRSQS